MSPIAGWLVPEFPGFDITAATVPSEVVGLPLRSTSRSVNGPVCDRPSSQIHSRYPRTLAEGSIHRHELILRVTACKFVCSNTLCGRCIFFERLALSKPHARTTLALVELLRTLGFALGGQAGSRLAHTFAIPISGATLIDRALTAVKELEPTDRFVGIDDFALRNEHTYGTILIDLERGRVIDLLEGRESPALKPWLKVHPVVEVLTSDRWADCANAATAGVPNATQVADRFHLVRNVRELVERILDAHSAELNAAFADPAPPPTPMETQEIPVANPPSLQGQRLLLGS